MKSPAYIPWSTVAVIAILASLIALGRDSVITWSLAAFVLAYVGIDATMFHRWRK